MQRSVTESLRSVFNGRDEVNVSEVFAVVFAAYSEQELLRLGAHHRQTALSRRYKAGTPISDAERSHLVMLGVKKAARGAARCVGGVWFVIDSKKGVALRVRR